MEAILKGHLWSEYGLFTGAYSHENAFRVTANGSMVEYMGSMAKVPGWLWIYKGEVSCQLVHDVIGEALPARIDNMEIYR